MAVKEANTRSPCTCSSPSSCLFSPSLNVCSSHLPTICPNFSLCLPLPHVSVCIFKCSSLSPWQLLPIDRERCPAEIPKREDKREAEEGNLFSPSNKLIILSWLGKSPPSLLHSQVAPVCLPPSATRRRRRHSRLSKPIAWKREGESTSQKQDKEKGGWMINCLTTQAAELRTNTSSCSN